MKKSIVKVTVALGIILGGLIPFSNLIDLDTKAYACNIDDESLDSSGDKGTDA